MRRGLSIAGVGLALLALWLWWPREEVAPGGVAAMGNERAAADAPTAATSSGAAGANAPQLGNEREAVAASAAAAEANGPQLRVRLRGMHAKAPWTAPLHLDIDALLANRDGATHTAAIAPDADGLAVFPLPAWAPRMFRGRIGGTDANYRAVLQRTNAPFDFTLELVLDVQVVALVTGRVVDAQRTPLSGARVVAFAMRDGAPIDGIVGQTNTRTDGTFRIAVPPEQPLLMVAVPTRASGKRITMDGGGVMDDGRLRSDLLPASLATRGVIGAPLDVGDIVLGAATPITGVVRWSDGAPVANAKVIVAPYGAQSGLQIDEHNFVGARADGRVIPGGPTTTAKDGSFALPAVAGGGAELWLLEIGGCEVVGEPSGRKANAGEHVIIELPRPVRLRVTERGTPVPLARLETEGWMPLKANAEGHLDAVLLKALRVRGVHEAARSAWRDVPTTAAGTTIDLEVARELTAVAIEFDGDIPVRNTSIHWRRSDGVEGREHLLRDDRPGAFEIFLEPGRYHLTVGPGGGERNGMFLLPVERDIDVGASRIELRLPAAFGGMFTLSATNSSGLHVAGRCAVLGADGRDCTVSFLMRGTNDNLIGLPGDVIQGGVNECTNVLPPGEYELLLDFPEHGAQRTRMTIKPREVTEVRVRLP